MRFTCLGTRIALAVVLGLALARPAAAQAKVVGTVVDDEGKAIKAATVTAEDGNMGQSFTATTDDKGRFTMIGLRPGRWRLVASAPGYLPEAGELQLRSGNNANPPMTIAIRRSGSALGALGNVSAKDLQNDLAAADALFSQQRWDDAVAAYRAVLSRTPALTTIYLQIAAAYRGKGDLDAARSAYEALLRAEPQSQRAIVGLSAIERDQADPAGAETLLRKVVEAGTPSREVLYELGELEMARGNTAAATEWYEKAAASDPSWGKPLYKLGLTAINEGDPSDGADFMTRVIAVDPTSPEANLAKTAIDQLNK
jgi:tetratricopeptide (TPR) repeat protein